VGVSIWIVSKNLDEHLFSRPWVGYLNRPLSAIMQSAHEHSVIAIQVNWQSELPPPAGVGNDFDSNAAAVRKVNGLDALIGFP